MLLFVVALYCEARPLVKYYKLKKDINSSRFDIYGNENISLVISGTGMIKSAVAAAYLLSKACSINSHAAFNIGICGSMSSEIETGTPVLFNKIVNHETGKAYYPDILIKHDLTENTLHSFMSPVTSKTVQTEPFDFADMEAAGFMEASSAFLFANDIYCLKIVSDHLDRKKLDPDFVSSLIEKNLPAVNKIIEAASSGSCNDILTSSDADILNAISEQLKLSVTSAHQLKNLARYCKIKHGDINRIIDGLYDKAANSRYEGKKCFERLKEQLVGE